MERQFFGARDLATALGISPSAVRGWIRDGKIRSKRINGNLFIPRAEFERLISDSDETPEHTGQTSPAA